MNTNLGKIGLSVVGAGWLLQRTEGRVRGMLRRGELAYAVGGRKIDPASVRDHLDGAYARLLLDVVLGGEFKVPRPLCRGDRPAPLYPSVVGLAFQTGFAMPPEKTKSVMDELALSRGPGLLGRQPESEAVVNRAFSK
jgi:hypothetical protein